MRIFSHWWEKIAFSYQINMCDKLNPIFLEKEVYLCCCARFTYRREFIRPFSFLSAKGELAGGSVKCGAFIKLKQDPIKNIICHPE